MTSGREYTLTAPDVYAEFTYYVADLVNPGSQYQTLTTGYVKLVENVDFYYEWQISTDSGNTWTTKGNRDKSLTDVIADDDVVYNCLLYTSFGCRFDSLCDFLFKHKRSSLIWILCEQYASCRNGNTYSSQDDRDRSSCS